MTVSADQHGGDRGYRGPARHRSRETGAGPAPGRCRHRQPARSRDWQAILSRLACDADYNLTGVELFPVTLSRNEASRRRGRPKLATGDELTEILERLAQISAASGMTIEIAGEIARVPL